jgi:hypothetical protein
MLGMDRPRLIRGLQIAWSVAWGILCVLLMVLWVRSYYSTVFVVGPLPNPYGSLLIETKQGRVTTCLSYGQGVLSGLNASPWGMHNKPLEEWEPVIPPLSTRAAFSYVRWNINHHYLILPYWFLTILSGTLAALPWIRSRFSLRTLLIATTLIAVVLGVVVWSMSS